MHHGDELLSWPCLHILDSHNIANVASYKQFDSALFQIMACHLSDITALPETIIIIIIQWCIWKDVKYTAYYFKKQYLQPSSQNVCAFIQALMLSKIIVMPSLSLQHITHSMVLGANMGSIWGW